MKTFHINAYSGEIGACKAMNGRCPFGSVEDHYSSADDARAAFEQSQGGSFANQEQPSPAAQRIMDKLVVETSMGGYQHSLTHGELVSVEAHEWPELIHRFAKEAKAARTTYDAEEKAARAQGKYGSNELEAARSVLRTAVTRHAVAVQAAELSTNRTIDGAPVPAGYSIEKAVYDLEGNFIGAAKDTRTSPQNFTLADGSVLKYRESQSRNPEKRRVTEATKGFYTGTAAVPVGLDLTERWGVRLKPAYAQLRKNAKLAIPVDTGQ